MNDNENTISELKAQVAEFRDARDWLQFHNPKDLAISMSIEAAELLEVFQWKRLDEIQLAVDSDAMRQRISEELADVVIYALGLSDVTGIDLSDAISRKLALNGLKYPVEKSRGNADKYTEL